MFQKNLPDTVKLAKLQQDESSYRSKVLQEIQKELNDPNEMVKSIALQKLFYLYYKGQDISWANVELIKLMSSKVFDYRKIAFNMAPYVMPGKEDNLIMSISLIQKELANKNNTQLSYVLSSLSQICTKDLANGLIQNALTLISHSKQIVRKKVIILISKSFQQEPLLMEKHLSLLIEKMKQEKNLGFFVNLDVLNAYVCLLNCVFDLKPELFPVFIQNIYELFDISKGNWLLIKLIILFNKIIKYEPRLIKKLSQKYLQLLRQTSAKSLEYEIVHSIFRYFQEYPELMNLGQEKLIQFLKHRDSNILGIQCLERYLNQQPKQIINYKQNLIELLGNSIQNTQQKILELLKQFCTKELIVEIVDDLLFESKLRDKSIQSLYIQTILEICKKDDFKNISNFQWLIFDILQDIYVYIDQPRVALIYSQVLIDCFLRVQQIRAFAPDLSIKYFRYLQKAIEDKEFEDKSKIETEAQQIIFQSYLFISAEFEMEKQNFEDYYDTMKTIISHFPFDNSQSQVEYFFLKLKLKAIQQNQNQEEIVQIDDELLDKLQQKSLFANFLKNISQSITENKINLKSLQSFKATDSAYQKMVKPINSLDLETPIQPTEQEESLIVSQIEQFQYEKIGQLLNQSANTDKDQKIEQQQEIEFIQEKRQVRQVEMETYVIEENVLPEGVEKERELQKSEFTPLYL